jgi:tetratricopeptide (TPR) repeat protein
MWCLWDLGRLTESLYGHWTFACVYLISGISASVASIVWNPGVLSVGASGAIFGLAGALISSYYLGEFSLPRAVIAGTLRSVVIFVGFSLFLGGVMARTDNAAHVGGLIMGLILGALIAKVAPLQEDIGRRVVVLLMGAILVTGGALWLRHSQAYLAHGRNGAEFLQEGNAQAAIAELQKSVKLRPDYAAGHATLSRAYVRAHDYEHAAAEMQRVIELNPQSEDARYRLGLIYLELKDPGKAQGVFAQLLKINPTSADGHAGLAATLSDQHRNAEALEEYKRVAAIDASYDGIHYNIGVQQARLKQYDDAIASLLKQREAGDDPDNENLLAAVYSAKGMEKEAADAKAKAAMMNGQQ